MLLNKAYGELNYFSEKKNDVGIYQPGYLIRGPPHWSRPGALDTWHVFCFLPHTPCLSQSLPTALRTSQSQEIRADTSPRPTPLNGLVPLLVFFLSTLSLSLIIQSNTRFSKPSLNTSPTNLSTSTSPTTGVNDYPWEANLSRRFQFSMIHADFSLKKGAHPNSATTVEINSEACKWGQNSSVEENLLFATPSLSNQVSWGQKTVLSDTCCTVLFIKYHGEHFFLN